MRRARDLESLQRLKRPLPYAALIAGAYCAVSLLYIHSSDFLAAAFAPDVRTLASIERWKGTVFVLVTGALLFHFARLLLRRIQQSTVQLMTAQTALLESERRATAGVVALSMAHDCNNQLQILSGNASMLRRHRAALSEESQRLLDSISGAIDGLGSLMRSMHANGRRATFAEPTEVELPAFLADSLDLLRHHERLQHVTLTLASGPPQCLLLYPAMLHDAIVNLVLNAADAAPENGRIEVRFRMQDQAAVVEVHDNGPGVAAHWAPNLFQAFQTTKPEGTGLGLLAVKACAELHEGTAEYQRSPLGGACFRMVLRSLPPAAPAGVRVEPKRQRSAPSRSAHMAGDSQPHTPGTPHSR